MDLKRHGVADKPNLDNQGNTLKFSTNWVRRFIPRLSIAKKIGYGYSLAIGIAVLGTTIGLISGDYYEKKAQKQLIIAEKQQNLLSNLENAVGELRAHPQRLVIVLGEPIWFDYETAKFFTSVSRSQTILSEFHSFIDSYPDNLATKPTDLKNLLNGYETNTESYTQLIKFLWRQIDPANLKTEEISVAQQKFLNSITSKTATNIIVSFDRLAESLTRLKETAESQQIEAKNKLGQAETLRLQIIVGSMLLSVAIAVALAIITARAIARPLEAVTQVARAITQESNFDLRSPVTTEDEVGSLATSLNCLVQWVGEYTHELELARQTLEERVEQRTEELTQALQELQQTQSQLIQTEKMSSLGELVAGIAHEINNPINFIYGNLEHANVYTQELLNLVHLYRQQYPHPTPLLQHEIEAIDVDFLTEDFTKILSSMKMGTERIRQIVLSLRNFSRLDESEMKPVDIHEGIENTLLILNHRLKRGIEVIKEYEDLPLVECYPAQLNQVFMNIISNAIDALEDTKSKNERQEEAEAINKGFPIQNKKIITEKSQILIHTERFKSNYIRVRIRDNGFGIPLEIKDKLFNPFFTTKPVGKGTGLGLSICYQIVEKHKGKIEVISEFGQGTEFAIALPIKTHN
ncbi:ATP-binding protein [Coleofasciculus sp. FACHB-T130]|uniref:sensor histidine kinase n=1 Tax=Cyanophyceae TaxID=3028117 RepID=UPI00168696EC|nr:ATP-binding protein [Coleofasciculus sp. FACHB-T130]MBD1879325.1 HAMP domain-containing protein [Coleofasciculus sp. FACHB-T130]